MKIITTILIFICNISFAQNTFERIYLNGYGASVLQNPDSGYTIFAGTYVPTSSNHRDINLIRTDKSGDTLWTKTFDMSNDEYIGQCLKTTDGGYILTGASSSAFIIKTDDAGDTLWTKYTAGLGSSIQQTSDGGYIIGGCALAPGGQNSDCSLVKLDSAANILWSKTYGHTINGESINSLIQTSDHGYIFAGVSESSFLNSYSYLVKTDSVGDTLWTRNIWSYNNGDATSVIQNSSGNYVIAGIKVDSLNGWRDIYMSEFDSVGNITWSKSYSNLNQVLKHSSLIETTDGGYLLSGSIASDTVPYDMLLIKTNQSGDTMWTRAYGGFGSDISYCAKQTYDHGYIIAGAAQSFGSWLDCYLVKTDSLGHTSCHEKPVSLVVKSYSPILFDSITNVSTFIPVFTTQNMIIGHSGEALNPCSVAGMDQTIDGYSLTVLPNPSNGIFRIEFDESNSDFQRIDCYNSVGSLVYSRRIIGVDMQTVDISDQSPGIYFVRLTSLHKSAHATVIKE